jgi:hypothetical protein
MSDNASKSCILLDCVELKTALPLKMAIFYYFLSRCLHKNYIDALFTIFLFQGLLFG